MTKSKTYDCFTYNGEEDILEIRLNILNDFVDQFIVIEARETFTGFPKPLYFLEHRKRFAPWLDKIKYYVVENGDEVIWEMAKNSPNTIGADHWKREFYQKECIKKALTHLNDDDIVFIGDVDEIWNPEMMKLLTMTDTRKLKLDVYPYYLNNRSNEQFWGSIRALYRDIKGECLNHLRTNATKTVIPVGWHFTSQGGIDEVRRKLNDSYTEDSYNTKEVQQKLEERFGNADYIGRGFTFTTDESELPKYILDNKEKYKKLWKE